MSDLFKQYAELTFEPTIDKVREGHAIVLETGLYLSQELHKKIEGQPRTEQQQDALISFQMVFAKGVAIKALGEGTSFKGSSLQVNMPNLLDPTSVATLTRTQFEAFSNFYNIYNSSNDQNLRDLLYSAWVLAGLKRRQKMITPDMPSEHLAKANSERLRIEKLSEEIFENPVFQRLKAKDQKWVRGQIRQCNHEFIYKGGKLSKPGWRELFSNSGAGNDVFSLLYPLMSMNAHPSNVSVFQFAQMFETRDNLFLTSNFLTLSKIIMAFMIASYCQYFPQAKQIFEELPLFNRVFIDSINAGYRGPDYTITDSHSKFIDQHSAEFKKFLFGVSG